MHAPLIDLIPDGSSWAEVVYLAKKMESVGVNIINSGIGWHEARIPTIATSVPRRAFSWVTKKLYGEVSIPIIASNRINSPLIAEAVLADKCADLVSLARPFLADPEFVKKAKQGRRREDPALKCAVSFSIVSNVLQVFDLQEPQEQLRDTYGKQLHQFPSKSVAVAPSSGKK